MINRAEATHEVTFVDIDTPSGETRQSIFMEQLLWQTQWPIDISEPTFHEYGIQFPIVN